jgi:hypothetical protein
MKTSKFIKLNKDILAEYVYDDGNNISEGYSILINSRDNVNSFVSPDGSPSNNTKTNQLFVLDRITNYYGIVNTQNYSFLQFRDYSEGFPIRFDTIKIHLPINYTFGEYIGCYVRIYTYDTTNKIEYNLSNFFYDQTDIELANMVSYNTPPLKFQEKLWGKSLNINIPSTYFVSRQMSGTAPKSNSLNANLTNGLGLSQNSPVFIDFSFLTMKKTINGIPAYYITSPTKTSLPQTPEFENLGVKIEHSKNGDFFEIFGIYNGNINEFKKFIDDAPMSGSRYFVEFEVTLFEQNIRGKSVRFLLTNNFNEKIEYRPIIKYTTTTAVIDVEMRLIDQVNESIIYRRASYGMLQDEVAKYSLNLTKINLTNANKPKIYGLKNIVMGSSGAVTQKSIETIKVDRTVLVEKFNLVAKSDNVNVGKNVFYGIGKLKIVLQPFDNTIAFILAKDISTEQTPGINNIGNLSFVKAPEYMDLTNMGEILLVIKNDSLKFETGLYQSSGSIDLSVGQIVFRIPESSMRDIKRIFESGQNVFYITSRLNSENNVIYSGLFTIFDSQSNIDSINEIQREVERDVLSAEKTEVLIDTYSQNNAIVYRRRIDTTPLSQAQTDSLTPETTLTGSSVSSTTKIDDVTYTISTNSSLVIDGFEWTSQQIKTVLNLEVNPTSLTFRTNTLFTGDKFLDSLEEISIKLTSRYLITPEDQTRYDQTVANFKNSNQ